MGDEQIAEPARRRAAEYAQLPSVWPAPTPTPPRPDRARGLARVLRTGVTAGVLLAGPPWLLWQVSGNPITVLSSWWSTGPFSADSAVPPVEGLRVALIWACWCGWAVVATLLAGSLAGVLRGHRLPRWRLPMPLHRLVFGLTGTATVALMTTPGTAAIASPAAQVTTATQPQTTALDQAERESIRHDLAPAETRIAQAGAEAEAATITAGNTRYEYQVRKGDTLSKVAQTWLQDPDRWPDICRLNKHRHFDPGGTLTDCDLIYPGWELRLPADAAPPPDAKPTPAPTRPKPGPASSPEEPTDSPPGGTGPAASPQPPVVPSASAATADTGEDIDEDERDRTGEDLVLPGGSVIPWALAVAISATAALVWLQRRRRYIPGTGARDDIQQLPLPVLAAQHHTHNATAQPVRTDQPLPTGGIGLIGSGADAAARGLIITALTTGNPAEPDQRAEVILDRHTLTELIGDTPVTAWPRLHITDTLDQALTLLDTRLLHRSRILDEHSLTDLGSLRTTAPAEEALPPLLLITHADQATPSTRARITFALTSGLDVTAVVLGQWPHGHTLSVTDDGHTNPTPDDGILGTGRLAVLDLAATRDLLATVREAHTGEPNTPAIPAPPLQQPQRAPARVEPPQTDDRITPHDRVSLRVLGTPQIENVVLPGRALRRKAAELAVYLACHPDGADTDTLAEHLLPDARMRQARQQIHTNASNLRHVLSRAGGPPPGGYLNKHGPNARYRLDPNTVHIDLWQLHDLLQRARHATPPDRITLLEQASAIAAAPLADGCDYEWITPHRERARRWITEAHLTLAQHLLPDDPQRAATVLHHAITLDPNNEELYRQAIRTSHALNDPDGIRAHLRALTRTLHDIDAEPDEETTELANQFLSDLQAPHDASRETS